VDDTLLLGGASKIMANQFKLVLDQYGEVSGGVINKNKSQIYTWNIKARALYENSQFVAISFLSGMEILQIFRHSNQSEITPRGGMESHPAEDKRPI
jgi:hypothetical protein